jgi:hypothetical protein
LAIVTVVIGMKAFSDAFGVEHVVTWILKVALVGIGLTMFAFALVAVVGFFSATKLGAQTRVVSADRALPEPR